MSFESRRTTMVDTQVRPSDVTKFPIIQAMLSVPREAYVPQSQIEAAYVGENLDLGDGRVVLEPRTFGKMLDVLNVGAGDLVLDIGAGLGYSAAVLAHMAEAVIALEEDEDMAKEAEATLSAQGVDNAVVVTGALSEGAAEHGPYDAIILQGGVEVLPQQIEDQLKDGGRIVCLFQSGALGEVRIGVKSGTMVSWRLAFNASAPLLPGFVSAPAFVL